MKITKQETVRYFKVDHKTYEVRVQIEKGNIITLEVDTEDQQITIINPLSKDRKEWSKLKINKREAVYTLIEEALCKTL